nr:preprotein translocase subunit YajC [Clostridia bacterium]
AEMRNNISVGDEVVTIGGICGKIVKTKDETLVIQVGADKVKFEIMRWSVSKVTNPAHKPSEKKEKTVEEEEAPKKTLPKRMKRADAPAEAEDVVEAVEAAEETVADAEPVTEAVSETPAAETEAVSEVPAAEDKE